MLLAIDTATRMLSLALHDGQQIRAELTWHTANQHTVELMPAIEQMMQRVKVTTKDLTLLAVSQGPGSFNGLRIGFSTAKGLAMALNIPMVAIPTLEIIATAQPHDSRADRLIVVVQAGRGRVCVQTYHWRDDRWQGQNDTRIIPWQAVLESALTESGDSGTGTLIAGEVDEEGHSVLESGIMNGGTVNAVRVAPPAFSLRRAGFLADLAWQRWRENPTDDSMTAVPFYLHQPGVSHP